MTKNVHKRKKRIDLFSVNPLKDHLKYMLCFIIKSNTFLSITTVLILNI